MDNANPNQLLLLMALQAQQQQAAQQQSQQTQQQKLLQQQMAEMAKKAAAAAVKPSTSSMPSTSSGATPSKPSTSSGASKPSPAMNAAQQQMSQMLQMAQMGMVLNAFQQQQQMQQKPKPASNGTPKKAVATTTPTTSKAPSTSSGASSTPAMTPELAMAWQALQFQALMNANKNQPKNQPASSTPQSANSKKVEDDLVKKMVESAVKKAAASGATKVATTPSTSSGPSTSAAPTNNLMQSMMLQALMQQMQQQQKQQQVKENAKKAEQAKKAKEAVAAKEAAKQEAKLKEEKAKKAEHVMKMIMANHQLQMQKLKKKQHEEHTELSAKISQAHKDAMEGDDPEEQKKTLEAMLRLPIQLGWRRQTVVKSIAASGVKGDVAYFAPDGKKMSTYSEAVRYLAKNGLDFLSRENFLFNTRFNIGEFIVQNQSEGADPARQEKEYVSFKEEDINKELARLNLLKYAPKIHLMPSTSSGVPEEDVKVVPRYEPPEEPLDPSDLNDEFAEEQMHSQMMSNGMQMEVRDRESDDLLVNFHDIGHLPEFARIENQCLDAQGFADALMIHEFIQNFGHVLGINLETTPKLEALCAGLAGDAAHSDSFLQLTRQLLRLALEFPGMGNEKRFGQGGGEMGLDRENFSEVLRLFLLDKGKRGADLSTPLLSSNFLSLTGEQKAAILAFLCDELVCSRNVVTEIDRNLEEVSRLKGEKWMREGKARALRQARSNKKKMDEKVVKEEVVSNMETDSEPPTRPVTPKKNGNGVAATSPQANGAPGAQALAPVPGAQAQSQVRKFTPGLGQCEVLTEQEESMSLAQMDGLIEDLHQESLNINRKIHDTNQKIRSFPFGADRFHRNYWMLAHTDAVLVESLESSGVNNPACTASEYASRDPPYLEDRLTEGACEGIDIDVIACVEDLVDEVIFQRAKADKKVRKRYRRIENPTKRGWWTVASKDSIESLRSCMLSRGIRERALHRLLSKPWFLNDLKFGTITLDPVVEPVDLELVGIQGWNRLNLAIDKLRAHMKMTDISVASSDVAKPTVVPTTMALAQIVKDGVAWKVLDQDLEDQGLDEFMIRQKILDTAEMVDPKYWRPRFRIPEGAETCQLFEDWKEYVREEATTTSQLMVALQALEGMIMWERSSREALCQICKSMDGDEMLVCDGCESGCHMECFRPRMTKVPDGDWFCQKCRQEKSGKPLCMFCTRETGHLHQCNRCAYHVHEECARDGPKETINRDTFICPHCQDIKQMRFAKRVMLRSESEEREMEEEEKKKQQVEKTPAENNTENKNGVLEKRAPGNLKRKIEPIVNGGMPKTMTRELCLLMLDELVAQPSAQPFLEPVNPKLVPGYKMVIAKPIDLRTIRQKNEKAIYETPEDFAEDVELMFANCRQFNIDHSEVGRAGMNLNKFFHKRWKQLKYNFIKRLRRVNRQS
ncbi:hypothetical protein B9Z55_011429 [Caenorhabditis nigoni]|uniref:Bromodomain adjacent to zinc finger domain protein 2B n=1 Tax=Caenorhabditis nigoni TaxID=1611254 RepID=A0A2G5UKK4_9PELO|nr:hypothetical protein B9Z55_011429 [Caenorhabditis nigoni]